jgi:hypothetical protein
MKKISIKNAEGEDLEYYILYPENANNNTQLKMQDEKNNLNSKISNPVIDNYPVHKNRQNNHRSKR